MDLTAAEGIALRIRDATEKDRNAIETLLLSSKLPVDGVADHLAGFVIAEEEGTIAGAIGLERYGSFGLLRSAVVSPHARGKGVGTRLVKKLFERARLSGVIELFLLTTTAEDYFPRFGFVRTTRAGVPEQVKASAEFRGACPDSAVVMRKAVDFPVGGDRASSTDS